MHIAEITQVTFIFHYKNFICLLLVHLSTTIFFIQLHEHSISSFRGFEKPILFYLNYAFFLFFICARPQEHFAL